MNGDVQFSINKENHFQRYLNYAASVIEKYNGKEPFHLYLKKYFSENKKHGSRDRKQISSLCYHYFRIGNAVTSDVGIKEKILIAAFVLDHKSSGIFEEDHPEWQEWLHLSRDQKIEKISSFFCVENIFPFVEELSSEVDVHAFNLSFLIQPKLFVRIRPGKALKVLNEIKSAGISFEKINENCLAFSQNEKVSAVLNIDEDAVVQDFNSQRVGEFFLPVINSKKQPLKVWDCCAASGGKSILAFDIFKNIELTVTDIRKNILENLKKRFSKAGITNYHSFVADLSVLPPLEEVRGRPFSLPLEGIKGRLPDLIIADVPCSGSGTWSRTPERLLFFPEKKIGEYAHLQKKIVTNAEKYLQENGYLLYITCSVFKKENEENVVFIQQKLRLKLVKYEYLKGYEMEADTLFAALFKKEPV